MSQAWHNLLVARLRLAVALTEELSRLMGVLRIRWASDVYARWSEELEAKLKEET